jgi:hypothetical protein
MTYQDKQIVTGEDLYNIKIETGKSWAIIGEEVGITGNAARKRASNYSKSNNLKLAGEVCDTRDYEIIGGLDQAPKHNNGELWKRAVATQERQDKSREYRASRRVIYDNGPVVFVCMADLHLGSTGVNYKDIDKDIQLLNTLADRGVTVSVLLIGDLLDNFIIGKLKDLRMNASPFLIIEEWGLVDYALEKLSPYLIGSVAGNHDNWSYALAGVDLLRERHEKLTPGILYDPYELNFTLQVGGFECLVSARHGWRGNSMYNPTHGIDNHHHRRGREFDVAIGAHTHRGGLVREFDNGGDVGYAMLCGSYKKVDEYAMKLGLPPALNTSAVALVLDDEGVMFGTSNLYGLLRLFQ